MKKIIIVLIFVILISVSMCLCGGFSFAQETKKIIVTAHSAILVDTSDDTILYEKNIHTKRAPASTVKLLTALVVLENYGNKGQVTISKKACNAEPTKVWLYGGAQYHLRDLLNAILISSANDASVALAEATAGTESWFADLMNEKAKQLGAVNSNFKNASGLPARGQYSTVYDLQLIVRAALKNPVIYYIMKTKELKIRGTKGSEIRLVNHNKILFRKNYPLVLLKTGYTKSAKHCYAGIIYLDNKEYAFSILKSKKPWRDIDKLIGIAKKTRVS